MLVLRLDGLTPWYFGEVSSNFLESRLAISTKSLLKIFIPFDLVILLLGINAKEMFRNVDKDLYTKISLQ